jgi:hypothetical protein
MCCGPTRLTIYSRDMRQLKRDEEADLFARDDNMDLVQRSANDSTPALQGSKRHVIAAACSHQRRSGLGRNRLSHAGGLF